MPVPRKRSCAQRRLAKARCCLSDPICSRCVTRNLDCDYKEARKGIGTGQAIIWPNAAPGLLQSSTVQNGNDSIASDNTQTSGQSVISLGILQDDIPEEMQNMDWDMNIPNMDALEETLGSTPWLDYPLLQDAHISTPNPHQAFREVSYAQEISNKLSVVSVWSASFALSSRSIPAEYHNLFQRKVMATLSLTMAANHVFTTLLSYSEMLLTLDLPPFIHHSTVRRSSYDDDFEMPQYKEPLANCRSFIPMYRSKTPASSKFVYGTLLREAQRFHNEYRNFDEWTKFAALQALSLYMILLASDNYQCIGLNSALVVTMGVVAKSLHNTPLAIDCGRIETRLSWEEWKLAESKRRTLILLWLVQEVINVDIGSLPKSPAACPDMDNIALPNGKKLWKASTKTEWEIEYKKYLSMRKSSETLRIRDLRSGNRSGSTGMTDRALQVDLENWTAQTDSFGALLLLLVH